MPQQLQTRRSTRKLSEVARHVIIPSGIVSTGWPAVEARIREFGDEFDEWQRGASKLILAKRENGDYAATVGGITLSIPRQVAKTYMVGRIVFALCTLFPNLTVLWTAHRTRTTSKTFGSLRGFAGKKSVAPFVANIRATNGEQEILFTNGSVLMFGAREQGFGRGFDEVDIEVFDEAQILTEKALEDMVAATNQSRFPAGALLFFMGTPPRPVDPGEAFKTRRRESLEVEAAVKRGEDVESDALYIECSADPDADPDDREQWAVANPSYPHRTPLRSMLRLRKNLPSDESWKREALGVWDSDQVGSRAISVQQWEDAGISSKPEGVKSFGVAFSFQGDRVSLAGSVKTEGAVHVELVDALHGSVEDGMGGLADWLSGRWRETATFVLAGSAGAGVLKKLMVDRGVPERIITVSSTAQYLQAVAMTIEAVRAGTMTHLAAEGQSQLDSSIAVCDLDKRGGLVSTVSGGDETPAEAISLALWGARTSKRKPSGSSERKAVFL